MDAGRRRELVHYGAPAAFLLLVTVAVLLIKSGLSTGHVKTPTTVALTTSTAASTSTTRASNTTTTARAARYYTIQSGDTLGAVAVRENTTVATLLQLNPGIDPKALHSGQRIRVG
jgi:LysM repeat protein